MHFVLVPRQFTTHDQLSLTSHSWHFHYRNIHIAILTGIWCPQIITDCHTINSTRKQNNQRNRPIDVWCIDYRPFFSTALDAKLLDLLHWNVSRENFANVCFYVPVRRQTQTIQFCCVPFRVPMPPIAHSMLGMLCLHPIPSEFAKQSNQLSRQL